MKESEEAKKVTNKGLPSSLAILNKASKTFLYPLLCSTGNLFTIRGGERGR